jgi:hypothetical protein
MDLREELAAILEECSQQDWDGYNARPTTLATLETARQFVMLLPIGTKSPSLGALPDGSITLEWHSSRLWSLTVAVSPDGDLHYAALLGAEKTSGTEPFTDEVPSSILQLIAKTVVQP